MMYQLSFGLEYVLVFVMMPLVVLVFFCNFFLCSSNNVTFQVYFLSNSIIANDKFSPTSFNILKIVISFESISLYFVIILFKCE